jgi:hypothetical protein
LIFEFFTNIIEVIMKQKKIVKIFYSTISMLLCFLMMLLALSLVSCQSTQSNQGGADGGETVETEECRSVVRVKKGVLSGKQISGENLESVEVPVSSIPEGAIDSIDAIVGKYATIDMVMGEYVFDRMISSDAPAVDENLLIYIVVSDKIEKPHGRDITLELQALIDAYPGRTIYFNDGDYTISSTLYLPTDKEKGVSFRLSNYAHIKAADTWSADTAMIALGAKNDAASIERAENAIMGGKIDGAGKAKIGISIENSANTFISNVTFENLKTSLLIKSSADTVNVEGVTVNGNGEDGSVGILNESSRGVFSTINMANVATAFKNSGKNNEFRNISAKCSKAMASSVGFYEGGESNVYSLCTADGFAIGYAIKDGVKSVFDACNAYWTSAEVTEQTAFFAEGTFNSLISVCQARFFDSTTANAYIKLTSRGSGVVKAPIFEEDLCSDKSYQSVLSGTVVSSN